MSTNKNKASWWIITSFIIVPLITSFVSTIHVISFFELSNYYTLSIVLAVAFELGALSSLAGLVAMDKISKTTIWLIFILLTLFQMMGNTYYAYDTTTNKMIQDSNLIKNFTELFGFDIFDNTDVIFVKRIIAIFSGAVLPIISLCFLHLLISYVIKTNTISNKIDEVKLDSVVELEKAESGFDTAIEKNEIKESIFEEDSEINENTQQEDFQGFIEKKKKKLEEDKANYSELLRILYKDGLILKNQRLPSYKEFVGMVDLEKYNTDTLKIFLTLCNYLDIAKAGKEQKIALKSYKEAQKTLDGYLTLNI